MTYDSLKHFFTDQHTRRWNLFDFSMLVLYVFEVIVIGILIPVALGPEAARRSRTI